MFNEIIKALVSNKFMSKKFMVAMTLLCVTMYLGMKGLITGENITVLFGIVGAGYGATNLANKKPEDIAAQPPEVLSRKFIIAVTILAFTTVLSTYNHMSGNNIMISLGIAGSMYGLVNSLEKKKGTLAPVK